MIAVPFEKHCSVIICGASASGKTTFMVECIKNKSKLFKDVVPAQIYYFYGVHQPLYDRLEKDFNVVCHQGAPSQSDVDRITANGKSNMIILDDLMDDVASQPTLSRLFTQGCHHRQVSVFFLTQNLYFGGKHQTTICRNAHYYVFTRSPANTKAVSILAAQLFPGQTRAVMSAYKDIMSTPYAIMLLDSHPNTPEDMRIRTEIFGDTVIYKL